MMIIKLMCALGLLLGLCLPAHAQVAATEAAGQTNGDARAQLKHWYFEASRRGDTEVLAEYIQSGWNLETRNEKGYTALILAAYHGHADMVGQLMAAGANPCATDHIGNSALMGAIFKGEIRIARTLMNADCTDPNQGNRAGQTPAMYAALFGRVEILNELVTHGADLDVEDTAGNSASALAKGQFARRSQGSNKSQLKPSYAGDRQLP